MSAGPSSPMNEFQQEAFGDKYEVLAKIREGGMGAVYKVRHRLLNEIRVIKVMRPQAARHADLRKRFLREAQTATRLKHPHLVMFHDFFVNDSDSAFMVMEYIDGVNLSEVLRLQGAAPIFLSLTISSQILSALGYLHRRGIVHRDVSPDNIMMTRDEEGQICAKLIDLGIARVERADEELTAAGEFLGKLRYSSPEQLTKGPSSPSIDARSDLYSFGVVLSELLTGVCPFPFQSLHGILDAHMSPPRPFFDQNGPGKQVPHVLSDVLLRSLAVQREERFSTAADFDETLKVAGEPFSGPSDRSAAQAYLDLALTRHRESSATTLVEPSVTHPVLGATSKEPATSPRSDSHWIQEPLSKTALDRAQETPTSGGLPERSGIERAEQVGSRIDKTEIYQRPLTTPAATGSESRKSFAPFAVYTALGALTAIAILSFFSHRSAETDLRPGMDIRSERVSQAPSLNQGRAPSLPPKILGNGSSVARNPTAEPHATAAERDVTPGTHGLEQGLAGPSRTDNGKAPRAQQQLAGGEHGGTSPRKAAASTSFLTTYCAQIEGTSYHQGVVKFTPSGFSQEKGTVYRAPRADAARIQIEITVDPEHPKSGEYFVVRARLVNGGDTSLTVDRVEELAVRAEGGFKAIEGIAVPAQLEVGGELRVYQSRAVLEGANTYFKELRVTDTLGDSWKASIRLIACPETP